MFSPQMEAHPHSFDVRIVKPPDFPQISASPLDDTPPYTPHSKSLDLLRSETASPIAPRLSLDTISTLKGQRISSPIFINSSTGVKPLPQLPRQLESPAMYIDELDEDQDDDIQSLRRDGRQAASSRAPTRASTMPRCFTDAAASDAASQPKTPSRRQKSSDHLLKSKFSMSPVQPSKSNKGRSSQDRNSGNTDRLPEGILSQDTARSTLGNWSHSIGMAARKLQKSAMPQPTAVEGYGATLQVPGENGDANITPEKSKSSLRTATSLASIRRFITPSRRTRKVSTTRGLTGSGRTIFTVEDGDTERSGGPTDGTGEEAWIDADGRASRAGLAQLNVDASESQASPTFDAHLVNAHSSTHTLRKGLELPRNENVGLRRRARLPPEFHETPANAAPLYNESGLGSDADTISRENGQADLPPASEDAPSQLLDLAEPETATEQASAPPPPTSKLKTLQLLARQPFTAFGRKFRSMEKSWRPSRGSQDLPRPSDVRKPADEADCVRTAQPTRRSEDLLSRASPRVCDSATMAKKSRSVELDRIQLPSKVIPLRPPVTHKQRPMIPDAFAKPAPSAPRVQAQRSTKSASPAQAHISEVRHPWMKQLQLPSISQPLATGKGAAAIPNTKQLWPKMAADESSSQNKPIPTVSLTAASVAESQPIATDLASMMDQQAYCRLPPSLLGQSLPIPPRRGRSRASTISSQSSTTSSPSGKVIVSRRSYGQRLRSPSSREETGSIRSVGTSILFTGSPPGTPELRRLMSPSHIMRTPSSTRVRSPPRAVLLPKYSPRRTRQVPALRRKPSTAFTDDSDFDEAQEWMDEAPATGSRYALIEQPTLRSRLEEVSPPPTRPGFLEMSEATHTLSNLVKTFTGSSGSLSLHSSPYKMTDTPDHRIATGTPRGLYGIMEADEPSLSRSPPSHHHLASPLRRRLISIASVVSTEANSSFEDSEELQKLLDSIMAADLSGGSYDTSGSRDMALLSPFGSPEEYRNTRSEEGGTEGAKGKDTPRQTGQMPPPPKFLLNDRPISPPDSSCMSDATHSNRASVEEPDGGSWRYTSFSVLDGHDAQQC